MTWHRSNMSHGKHRSGRFHPKRLHWSGWMLLLSDIERKRRENSGPRRTEPMFDSIAECIEWQKRTRFGGKR